MGGGREGYCAIWGLLFLTQESITWLGDGGLCDLCLDATEHARLPTPHQRRARGRGHRADHDRRLADPRQPPPIGPHALLHKLAQVLARVHLSERLGVERRRCSSSSSRRRRRRRGRHSGTSVSSTWSLLKIIMAVAVSAAKLEVVISPPLPLAPLADPPPPPPNGKNSSRQTRPTRP